MHTVMSPLHRERRTSGPESTHGQEECVGQHHRVSEGQSGTWKCQQLLSTLTAKDLEGCLSSY